MKTGNAPARVAHLRFYEELNDFLPADRRKKRFTCTFSGRLTVGRMLKILGVPVSAVDLVLANGESVGLSHVISDDEQLSLYPVFEAFDIGSVQRVRARPLRRTRFMVGPGLTRLASRLRRLGFDVVPAEVNAQADRLEKEHRIFLARSAAAIAQGKFSHALRITKSHPREQLAEVLARLHLSGGAPMRRGEQKAKKRRTQI